MRSEGFRALGFVVVGVLLGLGLLFALPRLLDAAGGAEVQIATMLKETEPDGLRVPVAGFSSMLRSTHHSFSRVAFNSATGRNQVELTATLDFTGKLGDIEVSSLGLERLRFVHRDGWVVEPSWAPTLAQVLSRLETRRKALEAGEISALAGLVAPADRPAALSSPLLSEVLAIQGRRYIVERWYLRFERDEVLVTEEGHLLGDLPHRPVDEHRPHRLRLIREDSEFFFSPSLM